MPNFDIRAFAEYPLSLTILGSIVIITAGIIYGAKLNLVFWSIMLLLAVYVFLTIVNSWWFKRGRFEKR
jgi:hypothetical protein